MMKASYKKLWKLLIDKGMKKKELCAKAGISPSSLTKMVKNGVTADAQIFHNFFHRIPALKVVIHSETLRFHENTISQDIV